jgi:hypothetical protein
MKDLASDIKVTQHFGPAVLSADQTAVIVDLQGYHSAAILLGIGIGGITFDTSNYIEFTIAHSDDNSTYTNPTIDDLMGKDIPASIVTGQNSDAVLKSLKAAHAAAAVYKIGYIGGKRYLRLDIEFTGTHGTGTPIFIATVLGHAEKLKVD